MKNSSTESNRHPYLRCNKIVDFWSESQLYSQKSKEYLTKLALDYISRNRKSKIMNEG